MLKSELIAALQESIKADGDDSLSEQSLIGLAFSDRPRIVDEWHARANLVLQIARAKTDAGFKRDTVFFRDVWPVALAALKRERGAA